MRGSYGELVSLSDEVRSFGEAVLADLISSKQILGRYVSFDRKGRGSSLNYDVYGHDLGAGLIVFQARQATRTHADGYLSTRKTYALAGRNENGSPFWHPVSASVVHASIRADANTPEAVSRAAMAWIFEVPVRDLERIVRQGDVALVPVARPRGASTEAGEALLADTHALTGTLFYEDGDRLYVQHPSLRHNRNQHADVAARGWYRVAVGRVGRSWDFSPRSVD